jgi:death-on-curing family protein
MRIKPVTVAEVEYTAHGLARKFMTWDEPIPDFSSRYPNVLESCLRTPFQTFHRKSLYKGLEGKGAMLFYLMIKNHPFENGNKRIAVMTLLLFLYRNDRWLKVSNEELYEFAKHIAASSPKQREAVIFSIRGFIKEYLIHFSH